MALKLLIFDCDGVILESVDAKTRAYGRVAAEYGQEAQDKLVAYHILHGGVSRVEKFHWFFEEVLQRAPLEGENRKLLDLFEEYCLDEVTHAQLVPGILDVLKHWHGKVPMFVASGTPHLELKNVIKAQGLSEYFTNIYGTPPGKTDLLRGILAETGIHPSDAVMVGDSSTDQYAAEAVKCLFYGRGEYFRHSGYPWHKDLTVLNGYLEELYQEA